MHILYNILMTAAAVYRLLRLIIMCQQCAVIGHSITSYAGTTTLYCRVHARTD